MPAPSETPPPRTRLTIDGLRLVCRTDMAEVLRAIYGTWHWCYEAVAAQEASRVVSGRRPLVAGTLAGMPVLVKRLYHGGALAAVTGDRFLSARRFETNLEMVDVLRRNGIGTSEIVFAAWRRRRGLVRGEMGFREVVGGRDAAAVLFGSGDRAGDGEETAAAVGRTVARLHGAGIVHHDLNLRNFLLDTRGEVLVLDVDKAEVRSGRLPDAVRRRNLDRLERSVRKLGSAAVPQRVDALVRRLRQSYEEAADA